MSYLLLFEPQPALFPPVGEANSQPIRGGHSSLPRLMRCVQARPCPSRPLRMSPIPLRVALFDKPELCEGFARAIPPCRIRAGEREGGLKLSHLGELEAHPTSTSPSWFRKCPRYSACQSVGAGTPRVSQPDRGQLGCVCGGIWGYLLDSVLGDHSPRARSEAPLPLPGQQPLVTLRHFTEGIDPGPPLTPSPSREWLWSSFHQLHTAPQLHARPTAFLHGIYRSALTRRRICVAPCSCCLPSAELF